MTGSDHRPLIGLILAGGRSSRMGSNKAELIHPDGRTLARRTFDLLQEAGCESIVISLRHQQEPPAGFTGIASPVIARDPVGASEGPLSGLLASMRLRPEADWLVLACDLPRLDVTTLRNLISSKRHDEPFLSYRSEFDDLPEPLCALYGEGSTGRARWIFWSRHHRKASVVRAKFSSAPAAGCWNRFPQKPSTTPTPRPNGKEPSNHEPNLSHPMVRSALGTSWNSSGNHPTRRNHAGRTLPPVGGNPSSRPCHVRPTRRGER